MIHLPMKGWEYTVKSRVRSKYSMLSTYRRWHPVLHSAAAPLGSGLLSHRSHSSLIRVIH